MIVIEQAELEKIISAFDFTLNANAKDSLKKIIDQTFDSLEELTNRQNKLKFLVNCLTSIPYISYYKSEFNTAYSFTIEKTEYLNIFILSPFPSHATKEVINILKKVIIIFNTILCFLKRFYIVPHSSSYKDDIKRMVDYLDNHFSIGFLYSKMTNHKLSKRELNQFFQSLKKEENNTGYTKEKFWNDYFHFEALLSIAHAIKKYDFQFPTLVRTEPITLKDFYYPFFSSKKVVSNSLTIEKNVTILTGANMSGKSTLLKAIGLCIFLANKGIAIPAQKPIVPLFKNIFVHINHIDDISQGLSHFLNELRKFKIAVEQSKKAGLSFAIFDELFQGTNVSEAADLTSFSIEKLSQIKDAYFFISTHLYEIFSSSLEKNDNVECLYLDCIMKDSHPLFTYKIQKGISDVKIGKYLFQSEGIYDLLK